MSAPALKSEDGKPNTTTELTTTTTTKVFAFSGFYNGELERFLGIKRMIYGLSGEDPGWIPLRLNYLKGKWETGDDEKMKKLLVEIEEARSELEALSRRGPKMGSLGLVVVPVVARHFWDNYGPPSLECDRR